MQINTLYQLLAVGRNYPYLFDIAENFVTIPDLFNYWLSGEITNEFTNATTTQCFDPHQRTGLRLFLMLLIFPRIFSSR
jgi:rhamnulokinase